MSGQRGTVVYQERAWGAQRVVRTSWRLRMDAKPYRIVRPEPLPPGPVVCNLASYFGMPDRGYQRGRR